MNDNKKLSRDDLSKEVNTWFQAMRSMYYGVPANLDKSYQALEQVESLIKAQAELS